MESHTKRFLRIFLFSSATFLQYLQSSSSSSFSGHTPPFLPSHFFIQGSYSGSLVFSALEEKEQESEFVAVNPARRSHRYPPTRPGGVFKALALLIARHAYLGLLTASCLPTHAVTITQGHRPSSTSESFCCHDRQTRDRHLPHDSHAVQCDELTLFQTNTKIKYYKRAL